MFFGHASSVAILVSIALLVSCLTEVGSRAATAAASSESSAEVSALHRTGGLGERLAPTSRRPLSSRGSSVLDCSGDIDLYVTYDGREPEPLRDFDDQSTSAGVDEIIRIDDPTGLYNTLYDLGIAIESRLDTEVKYLLILEVIRENRKTVKDTLTNTSISGRRVKDTYYVDLESTDREKLSSLRGQNVSEVRVVLDGKSSNAPSTPENLQVVSLTNSSGDAVDKLVWEEPSSGQPSSYLIRRFGRENNDVIGTASVEGTETSATLSDSSPEVISFYKVAASNGSCPSFFSSEAVPSFEFLKGPGEVAPGETSTIALRTLGGRVDRSSVELTLGGEQLNIVDTRRRDPQIRVDAKLPAETGLERNKTYDLVANTNIGSDTAPVSIPPGPAGGGGIARFGDGSSIPSGGGSTPSSFSATLAGNTVPSGASAAVAADVDKDGDQDVVAAFASEGRVSWYENTDGTGNFAGGTDLSTSASGVRDLAVADLNNNGFPEVVAATDDGLVLYGNGGGSFNSASTVPSSSGLASSVTTGDVDSDGFPGLVATYPSSGNVVWYDTVPTGFDVPDTVATGVQGASAAALADVNSNGRTDILLAASEGGSVSWLENAGGSSSTFKQTVISTDVTGASDLSATDIDGDFDPDLVVASKGDDKVSWFENADGSTGFSSTQNVISSSVPGAAAVEAIDANGNGRPDVLAAAKEDDTILLFRRSETETRYSSEPDTVSSNATGVQHLTTASLDADVMPDVLTAQGGSPSLTFFRGIRLAAADTTSVESDGTANFPNADVRMQLAGVSGTGNIVVERFATGPNGTDGISQENVSEYRFSVTTSGDLSVGAETEVRFDVDSLSGISAPSKVAIYKRPQEETGSFSVVESAYDAENGELVASVGSFSEFAFGSNTQPLPVEIARFEGTSADGKVQLEWSTASEQNNSGFAVERRAAGEKGAGWTQVGFVPSKVNGGTTDQAIGYQFSDSDLPYEADRLAYRLRQVDLDGSTSYSKKVVVERRKTEFELLGPAPNPAKTRARIRFSVPEAQRVEVALYNVLGQEVKTVVDRKLKGRRSVRMDVSNLSVGTYFLRLEASGQTEVQKMTVIR
jgi:hypothetical protein